MRENIRKEWTNYIKFLRNNLWFTILMLIIPSIISILIVNSDFGGKLTVFLKILLFITLIVAFILALFIIFIIKFLYFLAKSKILEIKTTDLILPSIELPLNDYFRMIFKNKNKIIKKVQYKLGYIKSDENWNIKIALMSRNYEDKFYIIIHTRIPGNSKFFAIPDDPENVIYIALENKFLGDNIQKLGYKRNFLVKNFDSFKLEVIKGIDKKTSEIKYYINEKEEKVIERSELISNDCLNNISFEIWSTYYKDRKINLEARFNDFILTWE